jgi:MFS family permease
MRIESRTDPSRRIALALAAVALLVHLLTINRYGYFRDELYYIACSRHLAFGYVDLAPLSALLLRIETAIFGTSLFALRLFPAFAHAATIVLTGAIARELGGRAWAVALACVGSLSAIVYLAIGNFYSLNAFEPLFWGGCVYLLVRILNGGSPRLWLWFGLVAGLGVENKHSIAFFGAGLLIALLITRERRHLAQPWIWLGGLIAIVVALPNILWQIAHHWPTWELLNNIAHSHKNVVLTPAQFVAQQVLIMNPATLPLWLGGLVWLLVRPKYRALGLGYLVTLAIFILLHGKHYYFAPIYPMLFAAGGVAVETFFANRLRWMQPVFAALLIGAAALLAPTVMPLLPPQTLLNYMRAIHFEPPRTETSHTAALPQLFADQFGWEEMVQSIARVYHSLPSDEQQRAGIYCGNYGEAGAVDFFGSKYGLPNAVSGHQNYYLWGARGYTGEIMIVLDTRDTDERQQFDSVEDAGLVESSRWAMPWEQRTHIYVCRGLHGTLDELWPKLKEWL